MYNCAQAPVSWEHAARVLRLPAWRPLEYRLAGLYGFAEHLPSACAVRPGCQPRATGARRAPTSPASAPTPLAAHCPFKMDFSTRMYRIRRTCLEMLFDRNYLITEVRTGASAIPLLERARPSG